MMSPGIPVFLQRAIQHGMSAPLHDGFGWQVWVEPNPCPSCQTMRCFFIVRQGSDRSWRSGCIACDQPEEQLMRATAKLFEVLG
jgi:hypothetical protein